MCKTSIHASLLAVVIVIPVATTSKALVRSTRCPQYHHNMIQVFIAVFKSVGPSWPNECHVRVMMSALVSE